VKWYLFLIEVNLTPPMNQLAAQVVGSYPDRATADADGAALCAILNKPEHVAPDRKIVWACALF